MQKSRMHRASSLEQDDFSSNRHPALGPLIAHVLLAKPVPTFAGHALSRLRMSFLQNRFPLLRDVRYCVSEDREETFHGF